MNRNESFQALPVTRINVKLIGATFELYTDDTDSIHVMVSGADRDVDALRIGIQADQLVIEQPAATLARKPTGTSWLQVTLRMPRSWKGRIDGRTVTGWINVRSLVGTDLSLESVSGMITASDLNFLNVALRSVTGGVKVSCMACEKCTLSSTSGDVTATASSLSVCSLTSITGNTEVNLLYPFDEITANSVTGDVAITAPITACDAVFHTVSGRIRTNGISIMENSRIKVRVNTVSGGLDIACPDMEEFAPPVQPE